MWSIFMIVVVVAWIVPKSDKKRIKRKLKIFRVSVQTAFNFMFRMKNEDKLEAFRLIHKASPRFLHIDFLGIRVLIVYDPEISKR